jgi:hypothetical protein
MIVITLGDAYLATAIYGCPFWLLLNIFGENGKSMIQQESWLLFSVLFGAIFLCFVCYRVYKLGANTSYIPSFKNWLKIAISGPWVKPVKS